MYKGYYLVFNNFNCLDLGLKIPKRPNFPLPERQYNTYTIEGQDGELIEDLDTFKDITIPVEFNFIDRKDINIKVTRILNWLNFINDYKMFFSDDLDRYYKVKMITYSDIERSLKVKGNFTLNFICEAYKYYKKNDLVEITNNNFNFISDELTYKCEPVIKVFGTGDINLKVNDTSINLTGISDHIIMNSITQEAYNDNAANLNNKMEGKFPKLLNGLNKISWTGSITKIELTPNWRSL